MNKQRVHQANLNTILSIQNHTDDHPADVTKIPTLKQLIVYNFPLRTIHFHATKPSHQTSPTENFHHRQQLVENSTIMTRSRRKNDFLHLSKLILVSIFCTSLLIGAVECSRKSESASPKAAPADSSESVIEEVNAKQLERILQDKDYVAVFWCKLSIFKINLQV